MKKHKKKRLLIAISIPLVILIGFLYYYMALPAINPHSKGFWWFIIVVFALAVLETGIGLFKTTINKNIGWKVKFVGYKEDIGVRKRVFFALLIPTIALILVFLLGSLFSSPIFNAKKYRELIQITDGDFKEDIEQISYNEIPLLDKASAEIIGLRKMGSMMEYVSQFEVTNDYTQINYNNKPTRVTPLKYGNLLKWFTNRKKGIPAYISINMVTQTAECVKLPSGMKYTKADHFGRNIYRYLRFRYPTYIFGEINFEVDEEGNPYWICPVKDFTIGLFGGETVRNVILVNAVTGEHVNYGVGDVPTWVDRVFSADLLISYYDYYGSLRHGYFNSVLSQKDCLMTTEGYNYLANKDDVWVYTGVTSVGGDESNVGFVLMNQRTAETKFYSIAGAEEYSGMDSAEGKVQHLNYRATFPLLLNIAGEPTYFISLKDGAGLVKQYAMVNIEKYTIVAIGNTTSECEKDYLSQLKSNNVNAQTNEDSLSNISGKIKRMAWGVVEGNSICYILLEGREDIFEVSVVDLVEIIRYEEGDTISFKYLEGEKTNTVQKME